VGKRKERIEDSKFERQDLVFLAGITLLAIGFRLFLMRYRFAVTFDEVNYLKLAASGDVHGFSKVLHPYWSPLYPFVVALFSKLVPNFELAGRLVSILCGSFILIPVFLFTRTWFGRRVAYYGALWLAFYPFFAFLSTTALTESLYTSLISIGIFVGWLALTQRSWMLAFVVGLLFGFAYLTRPEGIGFIIVFIVLSSGVVIFSVFRDKEIKSLLITLMAVLGFSFPSVPYLLYLHDATGEWTISAKGSSNQQGEAVVFSETDEDTETYRMLSEDNKEVLIDQMFHIGDFLQAQRLRGKPVIEITPPLLLKKYTTNLYRILKYVIPQVLTTTIFILMILGLLGETWSKERALRELYLLFYVGFFWFVVIPLFHINDRYFLPFLPICFIWVGNGLDRLTSWLSKTLKQFIHFSVKISYERFAKGVVLFFIFGTAFLPELGKVLVRDRWSKDCWADPIEQKRAGLWLKRHTSEIPIIMSRNHAVDFYAGNYNIAESVTIPQNDLGRVLEYAKHRGVDYIVLNERYKKDYSQLVPLLEETDVPDNLRLIYKSRDKSGLKTVIYQLVKE